MLPMSAQDTIPFMYPCFQYPDSFLLPEYNQCSGVEDYNYPPYNFHEVWNMAYFASDKPLVYGVAITSDSLIPNDLTLVLSNMILNVDWTEKDIIPIDSINCSELYYHKKMFYRYEWVNPSVGKETVPCHLFFFDQPVLVSDTFGLRTSEKPSSEYIISELTYSDGRQVTPSTIEGNGAYGYKKADVGVSFYALPIWGGIFPVMQLPCPPAAKPTVSESRQGLVRFNWWEGDTNLYQIAISSYPADSTLFVSDTLTDSTFIVNDSVMAALNLAEGRYYIHLRRACNYMDSPYHSLLWSEWGEGRMFYYSPEREGITSVDEAAPVFALSPNPASQTVTVEVFGVTSQGEETRQAASLQIVNLEGRIVAESRLEGEKTDLDVSHLSAGVYLVRLQTPQGSATRKLTIAR